MLCFVSELRLVCEVKRRLLQRDHFKAVTVAMLQSKFVLPPLYCLTHADYHSNITFTTYVSI